MLVDYFPFNTIRKSQQRVLNEIDEALKNDYKYIVLEAATGFGKSPIAITLADYFKSSYICTSTIQLQDQYMKDFGYKLHKVIGQSNFICKLNEELNDIGKYECSLCEWKMEKCNHKKDKKEKFCIDCKKKLHAKCDHKYVNDGLCKSKYKCGYRVNRIEYERNIDGHAHLTDSRIRVNQYSGLLHEIKMIENKVYGDTPQLTDFNKKDLTNKNLTNKNSNLSENSNLPANLPTEMSVYELQKKYEMIVNESKQLLNKMTLQEKSFISWSHYEENLNDFVPCNYYDQLYKGIVSSHTIFNYAMFINLSKIEYKNKSARSDSIDDSYDEEEIGNKKKYLPTKKVLIFDEGHLLPEKIVEHYSKKLTFSMVKKLTGFNQDFEKLVSPNFPKYVIVDQWVKYFDIVFQYINLNLSNLGATIDSDYEQIDILRGDLRDEESKISQLRDNERIKSIKFDIKKLEENCKVNENINRYVKLHLEELMDLHKNMIENPSNWVIDRSPVKDEVKFKPIDISEYCKELYKFGNIVMVMTATILDYGRYCKELGLDKSKVKFISIDSEFPVHHRPIYKDYVGRLNINNMGLKETHIAIANKISTIMKVYQDEKGIIHMPNNISIDDIIKYIPEEQRMRIDIVKEMSAIDREKAIQEFFKSRNRVLMSANLYVGISLDDEHSRFQIITKVPFANKGDLWVKQKIKLDPYWYSWNTALKLIQGYGRSIRNKNDYAATYILDSTFDMIYENMKNIFPKSFKDAVEYGEKNKQYMYVNINSLMDENDVETIA